MVMHIDAAVFLAVAAMSVVGRATSMKVHIQATGASWEILLVVVVVVVVVVRTNIFNMQGLYRLSDAHSEAGHGHGWQ